MAGGEACERQGALPFLPNGGCGKWLLMGGCVWPATVVAQMGMLGFCRMRGLLLRFAQRLPTRKERSMLRARAVQSGIDRVLCIDFCSKNAMKTDRMNFHLGKLWKRRPRARRNLCTRRDQCQFGIAPLLNQDRRRSCKPSEKSPADVYEGFSSKKDLLFKVKKRSLPCPVARRFDPQFDAADSCRFRFGGGAKVRAPAPIRASGDLFANCRGRTCIVGPTPATWGMRRLRDA